MSVPSRVSDGKITVPSLLHRKSLSPQDSTKITCLTAYDYPTARLLDEAGVEVLLVGDSLGMVMLGHETTLPVTVDEMLHHTRAVRKGTRRALVVADMPFGTYQGDVNEALKNAVRFVKEAGAEAVKVEGGERRRECRRVGYASSAARPGAPAFELAFAFDFDLAPRGERPLDCSSPPRSSKSRLTTLPVELRGSSWRKTTSRGTL